LSFYDQAAAIWRDVPDPGGEGTTLSGRGAIFRPWAEGEALNFQPGAANGKQAAIILARSTR